MRQPSQLEKRAATYAVGALLSFALAVVIGITTTADWGRLVFLLLTLCAAVFMGGATALSEFIDKGPDSFAIGVDQSQGAELGNDEIGGELFSVAEATDSVTKTHGVGVVLHG